MLTNGSREYNTGKFVPRLYSVESYVSDSNSVSTSGSDMFCSDIESVDSVESDNMELSMFEVDLNLNNQDNQEENYQMEEDDDEYVSCCCIQCFKKTFEQSTIIILAGIIRCYLFCKNSKSYSEWNKDRNDEV
jgi:hypothetical protein